MLSNVGEGFFDLVLQELELLLKLLDGFIHNVLLSGEDAAGAADSRSPIGSPLWRVAGETWD
ncbi:MAG: hypothetical protein IIC95_06510 [Chloroflexi bacterium]|nr:hypothetical protein [Chloroflexota bacterium]